MPKRFHGVRVPEMMMSMFSTSTPRLVANDAGFVAANSVFALTRSRPSVNRLEVAASALTSLAQLSAEIEGHPLGGGALKFEPGEARKWLLPYRPGSGSPAQPSPRVLGEIDELCRARSPEREFAGGIGAKKVDVSWSTEEAGLLLAISVQRL